MEAIGSVNIFILILVIGVCDVIYSALLQVQSSELSDDDIPSSCMIHYPIYLSYTDIVLIILQVGRV